MVIFQIEISEMRIFEPKYQVSNMDLHVYKAALRDLVFNTEESLKNIQLGSILRSLRVLVMTTFEERPETPLIPQQLLLNTMAQLEVELMAKNGLSVGKLLHILHPVVNHEVVMALGFNNAVWALARRTESLRKEGALELSVSLPKPVLLRPRVAPTRTLFRFLPQNLERNADWWKNLDWYRRFSESKPNGTPRVGKNGALSFGEKISFE